MPVLETTVLLTDSTTTTTTTTNTSSSSLLLPDDCHHNVVPCPKSLNESSTSMTRTDGGFRSTKEEDEEHQEDHQEEEEEVMKNKITELSTEIVDQNCDEGQDTNNNNNGVDDDDDEPELDIVNITEKLIERSSYKNGLRCRKNSSSNRGVEDHHHHHHPNRRDHRENDQMINVTATNTLSITASFTSSTSNELTTDKDYLEHIAKLQMDNLIPLKEDVADWLNRILNLEVDQYINVENFMEKLDNGVLVCKLIRIIENHICEKTAMAVTQPTTTTTTGDQPNADHKKALVEPTTTTQPSLLSSVPTKNGSQSVVKETIVTNGHNDLDVASAATNHSGLSRRSSLPNGFNGTRFFGHPRTLPSIFGVQSHQMKCWENAKSHTFFARDNVSNFLDWCRRFGVKDAVLFETEDLVSHVNQRNVVLCILEVARIACKKYSFQPAPGLVEFEQEIDREIEKELEQQQQQQQLDSRKYSKTGPDIPVKPETLKTKNRVCRKLWPTDEGTDCLDSSSYHNNNDLVNNNQIIMQNNKTLKSIDRNGSISGQEEEDEDGDDDEEDTLISLAQQSSIIESFNSKDGTIGVGANGGTGFIDVDSGCSYSSSSNNDSDLQLMLPRSPSTNSVLSSTTSSSSTSFGGSQDHHQQQEQPQPDPNHHHHHNNLNNGDSQSTCSSSTATPTPMTSELDHKVMQIAKTYYGKEARQGVQRLSEGKYKIANRIVFVRLLKARHVMVRVGGGWTTLSHFLARHGGDPNQQILPDELLPLDTKSSQMSSPVTSRRNFNSNNNNSINNGCNHSNHHRKNGAGTTHTLVISTKQSINQTTATALDHHRKSSSPMITPTDFVANNKRFLYNGCHTPVMVVNHHNHRNYTINSTPASRRSSISSQSPEPFFSTPSTATAVNDTLARPTSSNANWTTTKIPIHRRRSKLPMLDASAQQPIPLSSDSLNHNNKKQQLLRSTSSIITGSVLTTPSSNIDNINNYRHHQQQQQLDTRYARLVQSAKPRSMIPRSSTEFGQMRRYTNYLRSSQHITNNGRLTKPLESGMKLSENSANDTTKSTAIVNNSLNSSSSPRNSLTSLRPSDSHQHQIC